MRVHQLARRAARLARDGGAVRPVAPHGGTDRQGPGRAQADVASAPSTASRTSRRTRPSSWCRAATTATSSATASCSTSTEDELLFVGRAPTVNWLQFHAETGGFKVDMHPRRPLAVASARQGGHAPALPLPGPGPERRQDPREAERRPDPGRQVLQHGRDQHQGPQGARLRHGMAGAPGLEIWGPYAERDEIRDAILEAGKDSASCRSARAPTRPTRSSPAGFPRRCPPSTPARR